MTTFMNLLSNEDFIGFLKQHATACAVEGCHPREHLLKEAARRLSNYHEENKNAELPFNPT